MVSMVLSAGSSFLSRADADRVGGWGCPSASFLQVPLGWGGSLT